MADFLLQKPEAGQVTTQAPQPEDRLVFEFEPGDALLERVDDTLVLSFEDGARIELTDFYVAYTSENMPEFLIGGEVVPGEAFFAALSEDLMPAAGAGTGTALGSGLSVDFINGELFGGLDRLARLDQEAADALLVDAPVDTDPALNLAPSLLGFLVIPDGNDDNTNIDGIDISMTEAGVGRDEIGGAVNAVNPNKEYSGDHSVTIQLVGSDPDGDPLTYSITGSFPYGTMDSDPSTGLVTFILNEALVQNLNQGDIIRILFQITGSDGQGGTDSATITLGIIGTNDRPLIAVGDGEMFYTADGKELFDPNSEVDEENNNDVYFRVVDEEIPGGSEDLTPEQIQTLLSEQFSGIVERLAASGAGLDDLAGTLADFAAGNMEDQTLSDIFLLYGLSDLVNSATFERLEDLLENGAVSTKGTVLEIGLKEDLSTVVTGKFVGTDIDSLDAGTGDAAGNNAAGAVALKFYVGTEADYNNFAKGAGSDDDIKLDGLGQDFTGTYGDFNIGETSGEFTFAVNEAAQELGFSEYLTETIYVFVEDQHGSWSAMPVEIKVTGTNDQPEIAITADDTKALKEEGFGDKTTLNLIFVKPTVDMPNAENPDAHDTASGNIALSDVDRTDQLTLTVGGQTVLDEVGSTFVSDIFYIDKDGNLHDSPSGIDYVGTIQFTDEGGRNISYDFALNNDSDYIQSLDEGDKFDLSLKFVVNDNEGLLSAESGNEVSENSTNLVFNIEGTNDRPTVTAVENLDLTEDTSTAVTGKAFATDLDADDIGNAEDAANANLEFFVGTGNAEDIINTADKLVPDFITKESLENFDLLTGGDFHSALDKLDLTNGTTALGKYGYLSIEQDGTYTYKLYSTDAMQHMDDNEQYNETFTIYVKDKQGAWNYETINVAIDGLNDAPVIHHADDMTVTEKGVGVGDSPNAPDLGKQAAAGQIVATDVDIEKLTYSVEGGDDTSGTLQLKDLTGLDLTKLADLDVFPYDSTVTNDYGTLYFNTATGSYIFVIDQDKADALNEGDVKDFTFKFTVTDDQGDGTTVGTDDTTIKLTINGTNDQPTLSVDKAALEVTENVDNPHLGGTRDPNATSHTVSGQATATDVDSGDLGNGDAAAGFDNDAGAKALTFSVGIQRPTLDNILNLLDQGALDKLDNILNVGKLEQLGNITEAMYNTFAKLPTEGLEVKGLYGAMVIDEVSGEYTYTLYTQAEAEALGPIFEAAYWALQMRDEDDKALPTENFTVYVKDDSGAWSEQDVTVTVKGANDTPVIHHANDMTVQEAGHGVQLGDYFAPNATDLGKQAAAGQIVATDIDVEKLTFSVEGGDDTSGDLELKDLIGDFKILGDLADLDVFPYDSTVTNDYGTLYFNTATGSYIFVIDQDKADELNEGEDKEFIFTFKVTDDQGDGTSVGTDTTTVKLTIEGTNDKPVLSATETKLSVEENWGETANSSATGKVSVFDADAAGDQGETLTFSLTITRPELGNETLQSIVDSLLGAVGLPAGSVLEGVRDVIEGLYETLAKAPENTLLNQIPGMKYGDTETLADGSQVIYGLYGRMVFDANPDSATFGDYTYTLYTWDEAKGSVDTMAAYLALQHRDDNDTALPTENFTIAVQDSEGAWSSQDITVTVNGINDAPTIEIPKDADLSVTEAGVGNDVVGGAVDAAVDGIISDIFENPILSTIDSVIDLDGIRTSLENTLDAAFAGIKSDYSANFPNAGDTEANGKLSITDDDGATPLVLVGTGFNIKEFGFDPAGFAKALIDNFGELGLSFEDASALGGAILGEGGNLSGILDGSVSPEDVLKLLQGAAGTISGLGSIAFDAINIEALFDIVKGSITQTVEGTYGTLEMKQDGSYEYTLRNDDVDTNALNAGEEAKESFTIVAYDKFGQKTEQTIEFTVNGTNDKPIITEAENLIINEDQASVSGNATASDVDQGGLQGDKLTYFVGTEPKPISLDDYFDQHAGDIAQGLVDNIDAMIAADYAENVKPLEDAKDALEAAQNDEKAINDKYDASIAALEDQKVTVDTTTLDGYNTQLNALNDQLNYRVGNLPTDWNGIRELISDIADGSFQMGLNQQLELSTQPLWKWVLDTDEIQGKIDAVNAEIAKVTPLRDAEQARVDQANIDANNDNSGIDAQIAAQEQARADELSKLEQDLNATLDGLGDRYADEYITLGEIDDEIGGLLSGLTAAINLAKLEHEAKALAYNTFKGVLTAGGTTEDAIAAALKGLIGDEYENLTEHLNLEDVEPNATKGTAELDFDGDGNLDKVDIQEGTYGKFVINQATGEYTYIRFTEAENKEAYDKMQELGEGETLTESFTIYVQDENGAWDYKKIEVTITGVDDAPVITTPADVDSSDAALGTAVAGAIVFESVESMHNGVITIEGVDFNVTEDPAGIFSVSAGSAESENGYGDITITGLTYDATTGKYTLNYTYTQDKAFSHGDPADPSEVKADADKFEVVIKDGKGDATDSVTVDVNIADDGPSVTLSVDATIKSGAKHEGTWSVTPGGDGPLANSHQISIGTGEPQAFTFGQAIVIAGLGALTIYDNGTFEFDSYGDTGGKELTFTLHAKDGDNDVSSDSITIDMTAVTVGGQSGTVRTDDDNVGTNAATEAVAITLPAGTVLNFTDPIDYMVGGEKYGEFINDNGTLMFKQTKAFDHTTEGEVDFIDTNVISIPVKDGEDNTGTVSVTVTLGDDIPVVTAGDNVDTAGNTLGQVDSGTVTATITVDFGADGYGKIITKDAGTMLEGAEWTGTEWVSLSKNLIVEWNETTGTLKIGDTTFVQNGNEWTISYTYGVGDARDYTVIFEDGDGDRVEHTIVADNQAPTIEVSTAGHTTHDDALDPTPDSAISTKTATGSFTVSDADGDTLTITIGGKTFTKFDGSESVSSSLGTLTVTGYNTTTGVVSYTYEQTSAGDHSAGNVQDSFSVSVFDGKETVDSPVDIVINIMDDTPEADGNTSIEASSSALTASGLVDIEFGADQAGATINYNGVTATFDGANWSIDGAGSSMSSTGNTTHLDFGDVTLSYNGSEWLATLDKSADGSTKTFTVTDGDNDPVNFDVKATWSDGEITDPPVGDDYSTQIGVEGFLDDGKAYNVSFMIDKSGSVVNLGKIKEMIDQFIEETLADHAKDQDGLGGAVNLQLVFFNSSATSISIENFTGTTSQLTQIDNFLKSQNATGGTNYESAIVESTKWFEDMAGNSAYDDYVNQAFIVTDGQPTYATSSKLEFGGIPGDEFSDFWTNVRFYDLEYLKVGDVYEDYRGFSHTGDAKNDQYDIRKVEVNGKEYYDAQVAGGNWSDFARIEASELEIYTVGKGNETTEYEIAHTKFAIDELKGTLGADGKLNAIAYTESLSDEDKDALISGMDKIFGPDGYDTVGSYKDIFTPEQGSYSYNPLQLSISDGAASDDIVVGGMTVAEVKEWVSKQMNLNLPNGTLYIPTVTEAMDYIRENHADFGAYSEKSAAENDPDILMGGAGDDIAYGQGGEDLLIGDGSTSQLEQFAKDVGMTNFADYSVGSLNTPQSTDDSADLVQNLVDKAQSDTAALKTAAATMEAASPAGDDVLYGGEGDDILLGLGGDDVLFGGDGADIMLGGGGKDLFILNDADFNGLVLEDILIDGGSEMDVLLAGVNNLEAVKKAITDGKVTDVEVMVFGKNVSGDNADEVLQNAGVESKDDGAGGKVFDSTGWTAQGSSGHYDQFTKGTGDDQITILIKQSLDFS